MGRTCSLARKSIRCSSSMRELYAKAKHTVAKTGDRISVSGLDWRIVSAAGQVLKTPLPGAGAPNPYCAGFKRHDVNPVSGGPVGNTEDEQSVASHVTFGKFRVLYLGDFTWNQEFELMCPNNRIGTVDLFVVSRHGQPSSNSEALVHAVRPRVTIMNNGQPQRRTTGGDERPAQLSPSRGSLADSLRAARRPGVHRAGNIHRQHGGGADRPDRAAAGSRSGARRPRLRLSTMARRTGSKCRRRPMAASRSPTAGTASARPTRREASG